MTRILSIVTVLAIAATALPAEARDGNSSLKDFRKGATTARGAGGYGMPVRAVPVAIVDWLTGAAMPDLSGATLPAGAKAPSARGARNAQ